MEKMDISRPISIILDGSNYTLWVQGMKNFLIGRRLWRYITGDVVKPVPQEHENPTAFAERLENWIVTNHQILTWFYNTSTSDITVQFESLDTAKEVWDFLATRFQSTGLAHYFRLWSTLFSEKQTSDEPLTVFLGRIQPIWNQIRQAKISDDHLQLIVTLMQLRPEYESARSALLHRNPLPTLNEAIKEVAFEETRLGLDKAPHTDVALAVHHPKSIHHRSNFSFCRNCRQKGHSFSECPTIECRYCHKKGHIIENCPVRPPKSKESALRPKGASSQSGASSSVAAVASDTSATFTLRDLQSLLNQVLSAQTPSHPALSVTPGKNSWLFDSACHNHMTPESSVFNSKLSATSLPPIHTANNTPMHITHTGHVSTSHLNLPDTYCIPSLAFNLISVGQLCDLGLNVLFSPSGCQVQDPQTGKTLGMGKKVGRLFELQSLQLPPHLSAVTTFKSSSKPSLLQWHLRLGHASIGKIRPLVSRGLIQSTSNESFKCLQCQLAKQPALSFNTSLSLSKFPFALVHSDIWGPSPTLTMSNFQYFVIFIDDYSRYTWIYLLKQRSELPQIYIKFATMIKTQFSSTIKTLRTDNAMEYKESSTLLTFLDQQGTLVQRSCPGTSQQNGRAERKHRHILDSVRALLLTSSCPEKFWGEAALTTIHTINRTPTTVLDNLSPYEKLFGKPPNYHLLKPFGCVCFVLLQPQEHNKLESRARLCCFLGYGIEHKGYRCWDPISNRIRISRHVTFWEDSQFSSFSKFHSSHSSSTTFFTNPTADLFPNTEVTISHELDQTAPSAPSLESTPPSDLVPALPRRSTRVSRFPSHLAQNFHCFSTIVTLYEPNSYREASTDPNWQQAMDEELRALEKTHTWDLVDLPSNKTAIGCKWVFKIKTRADGSVERYKARLVAKGYSQEYGIDYEETFAPVARITSVRSLLAIAAVRKWPLFQMDVKNAFLNGDLQEDVYMQPPPGYSRPAHKVCKLRKALYGLKQAPRAWFAKFSTTITQFGFVSSPHDSALFFRRTDRGLVLLLLYVDDMIITGDDSSGISELQQYLSQQFEMKNLGTLGYFLGLEVSSNSDGYFLSQAKYASDLLSRAGITDNKIVSTPLEPNIKLTSLDGTSLDDPTLYRQLVGSLVYLTVTRPDIAYAVHTVSQFMSAPRSSHFSAILRILRYVKGTLFHGLHFSSHSSLVLSGYSDADWAGDPTDRRSTTGFCFFLGDSLISWRSKKQTVTARSSTESEYRALADATAELLWLRRLLADMGAPPSSSTILHCDNRSAIQIAHNDVFHERTKHIEIDCHFIRNHVTNGNLRLVSISSANQTADIFTKTHFPTRFLDLISKLKLASTAPP